MGDRANIIVKEDDEQVCLYTHWGGEGLPNTLHTAISRSKERWDDFAYLTRVIFCDMIREHINDLAGYGITQKVHDGNNKIIEINVRHQTIKIGENEPQSFCEFEKTPILHWETEKDE